MSFMKLSFLVGFYEGLYFNTIFISKSSSYASFVKQDIFIRKFLKNKISSSFLTNVIIYRVSDDIKLVVKGLKLKVFLKQSFLQALKQEVSFLLKSKFSLNLVSLNFLDEKDPYSSAFCVSYFIKQQIEKRVSFRVALRTIMVRVKQFNSSMKGIKVQVSGRLNGAEIARTEWIKEGRVPLHRLSADINYNSCTALEIKDFNFIIDFVLVIFIL